VLGSETGMPLREGGKSANLRFFFRARRFCFFRALFSSRFLTSYAATNVIEKSSDFAFIAMKRCQFVAVLEDAELILYCHLRYR
jgi:hypothetical protein